MCVDTDVKRGNIVLINFNGIPTTPVALDLIELIAMTLGSN